MFEDEKQRGHDFFLEKSMYNLWLRESGESNQLWIEHLKNCVKVAMEEALTETQSAYISLYMSGYNQVEIAAMFGVNKSTVCRTVARGLDRLINRIKYATPRTLRVEGRVRKQLTRLYSRG